MIELLQSLLPAAVSGAVCGLVFVGWLRAELRYMRRELTRAHKRLDLIAAPNFTLGK